MTTRKIIRTRQPQTVVGLAPEVTAKTFAVWNPGIRRDALIGPNAQGSLTNASYGVGAGGNGTVITSLSGRWATTSGCGIALGTSEDKSLLVYLDQTAFASAFDYLFSVGTGGSGWGLASRHSSIGNNAGVYDGVVLHNLNVALPSSGRIAMLTCHNAASQTLRTYINGRLVHTASGVTGAAILSTYTLTVGNVWSTFDNAPNGVWYLGAIVGRDLSHVGAELTANPWQLFAPRREPIWVGITDPVILGTTPLTIAEAVHAHTADNLTLSASGATDLTIADGTHSHTVDNIGLTLDTYLAIQETLHAHNADNLTLSVTGATNLTIADGAHAHAADNIGLTLDTYLAIAEAVHAHAADNPTLSTGSVANLVIADGAHGHSADNLTFTLDTWLTIADALHAHNADNIALTLLSNLTIADAAHGHTVDNVVLAFPLGALSDAEFRQMYEWVNELALIHGLISGSALTVTPTSRNAGAVDQTIGESGTTITVTRT